MKSQKMLYKPKHLTLLRMTSESNHFFAEQSIFLCVELIDETITRKVKYKIKSHHSTIERVCVVGN